MIHGFTVPAGMELGHAAARLHQRACSSGCARRRGAIPGFSALVFSVVVFGFVGGITGVTIGTEQINIIAHNTLRVPGHFHATVVSGTALAFMGVTYYVIPLIFQQAGGVLEARQDPAVPVRGRHADLLAVDDLRRQLRRAAAPLGHHVLAARRSTCSSIRPWTSSWRVMALGGLLAAAGAFIFIAIAVKSVFFGEPHRRDRQRASAMAGMPQGLDASARSTPPDVDARNAALHARRARRHGPAPGTIVLVFVFLAAFIVYFFVNWKILSFLWRIG